MDLQELRKRLLDPAQATPPPPVDSNGSVTEERIFAAAPKLHVVPSNALIEENREGELEMNQIANGNTVGHVVVLDQSLETIGGLAAAVNQVFEPTATIKQPLDQLGEGVKPLDKVR